MNTLLLDTALWDLAVDANGNIAMATDPYSTAQDVAFACRFFQGDYYFDTTLGIPYQQRVLGDFVPVQYLKSQLEAAAESVPGVVNAKAFLSGIASRNLTGQVQFTDTNGETQVAVVGG